MCEYCNALPDCPSSKEIVKKTMGLGILGHEKLIVDIWAKKEKYVLNIEFAYQDIEADIKYCPMCGRKLGENENV